MFSFMGALIIDEVVKTLIEDEGLDSDSSVILAGSRYLFLARNVDLVKFMSTHISNTNEFYVIQCRWNGCYDKFGSR